jgi:hypothetical protein
MMIWSPGWPDFGGNRPVLGSWLVDGEAVGVGIRAGRRFKSSSRREVKAIVRASFALSRGTTMGLIFRKTVQLGKTSVNLSRRGASLSRKLGPLTLNSRGRATVRLGKGFSWRLK